MGIFKRHAHNFRGASDFTHDVAGRLDEMKMIWQADSAKSSPPKKYHPATDAGGAWNNHVAYLNFVLKLPHFHTTHHLFQAHPQGQLPKRNMKGNWKYSLGSFKRLVTIFWNMLRFKRVYLYTS